MKQYLISVFDCVVPRNSAFYISIPITTGADFLSWHSAKGKELNNVLYDEAHRKDVILPNIEKGIRYIRILRDRHPGKIVIEPTSLEVPDWSQKEYQDFWVEVIKRFANRAYFCPGWNYSRGCATEFLSAIEKGIEIFDLDEKPISVYEGSSLIKKAINEYLKLQLESEFLSNITAKLDSINSAHERSSFQR